MLAHRHGVYKLALTCDLDDILRQLIKRIELLANSSGEIANDSCRFFEAILVE